MNTPSLSGLQVHADQSTPNMSKPFSPASERNREPILTVLREHFAHCRSVLEIGSGTGQHAVHFAAALPHLIWQSSDRADNLPGIQQWLDEAALPNTPPPLMLDVSGRWPQQRFDAIYTANTLHIMSWAEVEQCFAGLAGVLNEHAMLVIYGPFRINGAFTSDSNAVFDAELRARGAHMGIRNLEQVDALAQALGLQLTHQHAMPANNHCMVWQR